MLSHVDVSMEAKQRVTRREEVEAEDDDDVDGDGVEVDVLSDTR